MRTRRYRKNLVVFGAALIAGAVSPPACAAVIGTVTSNGYVFTNFDPTLVTGAAGSNVNGISNTGQVVGTQVDVNNASVFVNFAGTPTSLTTLNTGTGQIAFGINSAGNVVGGNGQTAFYLPNGGSPQTITVPGNATNAFGINDGGTIVGQYSSPAGATPGFVLPSIGSSSAITINSPSGPNVVNAQGINNNGLAIGFYVGTDGQVHGFQANTAGVAAGSTITGIAIADPTIPVVPGEPGATFVFSQLLGINDTGLVSGYYGDSTTSQHGFLYNTKTGTYTFLDDPAEGFHNGVEVTQITGITNAGELAGFYTDANGIAHSFIATPAPEPGSLALLATGLGLLVGAGIKAARRSGVG
jgi:hypothetical protein